jgi:hypothetical protein
MGEHGGCPRSRDTDFVARRGNRSSSPITHRRRPATGLGKTRNDLADLGWIENDSDHHRAQAFLLERMLSS